MKKIIFYLISVILISSILFSSGCNKKGDEVVKIVETDTTKLSALDLAINEFIWGSMNTYYLWTASVPALDPNKYKDLADLDLFLNKYTNHETLFNALLYKYGEVDKWSWIVDDYVALENGFQGITKSMGYEYGLVRISNSDNIFGYVRYVIKGSPAEKAGLKRGEIFIKVDNQQLTVSNYQSLLSDNISTYSLSFANIISNSISPNTKTLQLTSAEIHENPIYLDTILVANNMKIGYLVYNGFMSSYDNQLNDVFKYFKDNAIKELILDLRYNPGGAGSSAVHLASMIYGTYSDKLFFKNTYNTEIQNYINSQYGEDYFSNFFTDKIDKTDATSEAMINTLNLTRLWVITTRGSASASELLINGLKPYMTVTTIGTSTYGKYVGSITLKDYDSQGKINPKHTWALQPIVFKYSNALGVSDFVNGLPPTVELAEDYTNLLPFGDIDEPLLRLTLDQIKGLPAKKTKKVTGFEEFADSKDIIPHGKELHFKEFQKTGKNQLNLK